MNNSILEAISSYEFLHPYILVALGYSYEKIAVSLQKSVSQINRYNPYSRSKKKCLPPLTVCKLARYEVKEYLQKGNEIKNISLFNEYLMMSKNL